MLEQHVYDEQKQLVGSAFCSGHEYHSVDGVALPKRIMVQVPQGMPRLQLDVDRWAVNQPLIDAANAFELPRSQLGNYPFVDMADPKFVPPGGGIPAQPASAKTSPSQAAIPRGVRGFGSWR